MDQIIDQITDQIVDRMTDPDGADRDPLARTLTAAARVYGGATALRARYYARRPDKGMRLPCTVISIGNLTVGGTGKTPMTIHMAETLSLQGKRVVVISRGYARRHPGRCDVVTDGGGIRLDPRAAGDEPYLMARTLQGVPVMIGKDRVRTGQAAIQRFRPDIILLDDAFQHLRIHRDLDIVLLDSRRPFGNGHTLPRGILREPLSALKRAHAVVMTRTPEGSPPERHPALPPGIPVFRAAHRPVVRHLIPGERNRPNGISFRPDPSRTSAFSGARAFLFSGIARNALFRDTARSLGARVVGHHDFPDHYWYTPADLKGIFAAAGAAHADLVMTTAKDWVRIPQNGPPPMALAVLDVQMDLSSDHHRFWRFVQDAVGA